jgi:hypothetical protein
MSERRPSLLQHPAAEFAALAAVGAAIIAATWMKWFDPVVDFGRELYIAWRLSEGDVLQRDHAFLDGPLPPYANALWMRLLGPSILAVVLANIGVAAATMLAFRAILARAADRGTAFAGALFFLAFAMASCLVDGSNFTYLAPYSHPATYGMMMSAAAVAAMGRAMAPGGHRWWGAVGVLWGGVFLTKGDLFLALSVAVCTGLATDAWAFRRGAGDTARRIAWVGLAAVPPAVSLALFSKAMPAGDALRATLGTWATLARASVTDIPLYQSLMGIDGVPRRVATLAARGALWGLYFGAAFALAWFAPQGRRGSAYAPLAAACACMRALAHVQWTTVLTPLPAAMAALVGWCGFRVFRTRQEGADPGPWAFRLVACVWALAAMAKVFLNVQFRLYGFLLPVPAMLMLLAALACWLPEALERRGRLGSVMRVAAYATLAGAVIGNGLASVHWYGLKTARIGEGANAFRAEAGAAAMQESLDWLRANMQPGDTLAAIPEGCLYNLILQRRNPTRHSNPVEIIFYGEDEIAADYAAHPPDWIVFTPKDLSPLGYRYFGWDFARDMGTWMKSEYEPVAAFGEPPSDAMPFGVQILRRRAPRGS